MTRRAYRCALVLFATACAAPPRPVPPPEQTPAPAHAQPPAGGVIADLDTRIARADKAELPALLLQRGLAHLVAGQNVNSKAQGDDKSKLFEVYGASYVRAIQDFERVTVSFPESAEAAEATYQLGQTYDHPNLTQFSMAMLYYRQTIERYPGSDEAARAKARLEYLEGLHRSMRGGAHGSQ